MATVRFQWSPVLIDLRREVCPAARWEKRHRQWIMTDADAAEFLQAAHARMDFARLHAEIRINDVTWRVGFVAGAPCQVPGGVDNQEA